MTQGGAAPGETPPRGLAASLAQLGRTLAAVVHTRAELLTLELQRERSHIVRILLLSTASVFFLMLGTFTATIFIIAYFWDSYRLTAIGLLTVGYLAVAVVMALIARKEGARAARPFAASIAQLRQDRDRLTR